MTIYKAIFFMYTMSFFSLSVYMLSMSHWSRCLQLAAGMISQSLAIIESGCYNFFSRLMLAMAPLSIYMCIGLCRMLDQPLIFLLSRRD